ncbi:MAG: YkgJ family cysteine cluster protein [Planctomycetaceae bacterium]|nr:YkgJ family cysteine cluster protein [Planctomycetaceae bacterium]
MPTPHELVVLESCDGCTACCLPQGAPPDYVALRINPHFADDPSFEEDVQRLNQLPSEAAQLLDHYLQQVERKEISTDGPCVWLNDDHTACRFYDHRPSTCRVFERGSPGCHYYRRLAGI